MKNQRVEFPAHKYPTPTIAHAGEGSRRGTHSCSKALGTAFHRIVVLACLVILSAFAAQPAFAEPANAGQILDKVNQAYESLQNFHIAGVREIGFWQGSRVSSQHFEITLDEARSGRARLVVQSERLNATVVSDGKTKWQFTPGQNVFSEEDVASVKPAQGVLERPPDLLKQFEGLLVTRYEGLSKYANLATLEGEDKIQFQGAEIPCYRLKLQFKNLTAELWIDQTTFFVLRETVDENEAAGGIMSRVTEDLQISGLDTAAEPSPKLFQFTPPAGAHQVSDLNLPGLLQGLVGVPARDFTLNDLEGKPVSLKDYRGKIVVLGFWASWCGPCREELPTIQKLYEQRQGKDVVILEIDDESLETVRRFLKENHYSFPALVDPQNSVHRAFAVRSLPTVFFIDRQGIIVRQIVGWGDSAEILESLKAVEH